MCTFTYSFFWLGLCAPVCGFGVANKPFLEFKDVSKLLIVSNTVQYVNSSLAVQLTPHIPRKDVCLSA